MLSRRTLGFRVHTRKLNRRSFGFRKLNRRQLGLKADEHLVTCNQRNLHQGEKFEWHPPELSLHVEFSKLNRSLKLGLRMPELQTMVESGNIKECRIATRYHRSLAGTSGCSRPLQLLMQSEESSTRYTLVIKQLSSTEQVQSSLNRYTSPGDKQEDASDSMMTDDGNDNDREQVRRDLVIKIDDQRESSSDARAPLIVGKHADASGFSRTMIPFVQPETDKKEYRYSDNRCLSPQQSYVIVPST